jgi:membrane-associated phospholipid phosphatase
MTPDGGHIVGWPHGAALRGNLLLTGIFAAYFWLVYSTGNFVALHAGTRFQIALPFEAQIPFVPWTAAIYLTVMPLLWLAPFIFRTPERLLPLFVTLCVEVTIAGIVFCLLPTELSFPVHTVSGPEAMLLDVTCAITLQYNCLPSLHVAIALTAAWAYQGAGGRRWRVSVWCWAAAIVASTLSAHQHHLADVAAGAALSMLAVRCVPWRVEAWQRARSDAARGVAQHSLSGLT